MFKLRYTGLRGRSVDELARDDAGVALVEFALALPVMLLLYFGVVELSAGIRFSQQFDLVAHTVGDITGQLPSPSGGSGQAQLTDSAIQGIFGAAKAVVEPFSATPLNITISEVLISNDSTGAAQATLDWTVGNNGPNTKSYSCPTVTLNASSLSSSPKLPTGFPDMSTFTTGPAGAVIVAEISYVYVPRLQLIAGLFGGASGLTFSRTVYSPVRNTYINANYSYLANHILDAMTSTGTPKASNCVPGGN